MKLSAAIFALVASVASAKIFQPGKSLAADSKAGLKLLNKATVVTPARHLEQNNNNNNYYNYEEGDYSFLAKYNIKYLGCASLVQVSAEEGGGDEEGILYSQHLIRFALCTDCGSCSGGGEYVVNMLEFIDAYTEAKLEEQEWKCEQIRENCYNDDENYCYSEQGADECIEYEGQEEFEIQRYLECAEMENQDGGDNNNNNNGQYYNNQNDGSFYGQYYVGPYCSARDGHSIYMGVFKDAGCVNRAESSVFETYNYGMALPYASESIIEANECMSCMQVDQDNQNYQNYNQDNGDNNNNNYYYNQDAEITELCEQSYERAARCEKNMDKPWQDTSGCDYIQNILPRLESASRAVTGGGGGGGTGGGGKASVALAWVFAATTVMFGAYAFFLYRKIKRGSVDLSSQDGVSA